METKQIVVCLITECNRLGAASRRKRRSRNGRDRGNKPESNLEYSHAALSRLGGIVFSFFVAVCSVACHLTTTVAPITTVAPMRVIVDSPNVSRLIAEQEANQIQFNNQLAQLPRDQARKVLSEMILSRNADYPPGRSEFLKRMADSSSLVLAERTKIDVLAVSGARCEKLPIYTTTYIKFKVANGPSKGKEVWACISLPVKAF